MSRNIRTFSIVVAAIVLVVGTYIAYEKYTRRNEVVALVNDTGTRLRAALQAQAAGGGNADAEASAKAVEAHARTLHSMNSSSFRPLADAADDYFVTAREILRRQADIQRARTGVTTNLDALNGHIKADRGRSDWPREAVQLKEALDKDARDYKIAVDSYASLLGSLTASQMKIAPFVDSGLMIDERLVRDARQSALDAYAATDQNIRQVTNLDAYRRRR
jgi:hypothetical protein